MPFILARPVQSHDALSWLSHLRSIQAETRAQWVAKKKAAKERSTKPPAKPWSFRRSPKGTPIITIRGRKPKYLSPAELQDMLTTYPADADDIRELIVTKAIPIKEPDSCGKTSSK